MKKVRVQRAMRALTALGYRLYEPPGGKLHARRGQDHITIDLRSRDVTAHRDMSSSSPLKVH